jgi:methylated-DNA-[protein]-cysteine S-methyltransferase
MFTGYSLIDTDWGVVAAVWSEQGLWRMSFPRSGVALAEAEAATAQLPVLHEGEWPELLARELRSYFRGVLLDFTIPVDWRQYTPFRAEVLRYTAAIPYGVVSTYGETARAVGHPRAARAAGGALHSNRTPIVVPCHRVIGANGSLTGFGGGLDMKQALLLLEKEV